MVGACLLLLVACGGDERSRAPTGGADAAVAADAGSEPGPTDAGARSRAALVRNTAWRPAEASEDPFASSSDAGTPRCTYGEDYGEEPLGGRLAFFVRTDACAALTVRQASRVEVRAGDELALDMLHFPLTASEPASAYVAVQLGDVPVWQADIPIPAQMSRLEPEWVAPETFPAGTQVYFHVHNHGENEYLLLGIDVLPAD